MTLSLKNYEPAVMYGATDTAPTQISLTDGHIMVGNGAGNAADVAVTGDVVISNAGVTAISAGAISLADLSAGITPSHVVKFAGKITWSGSGASLATTVTGLLATDIVLVTIQKVPTQAAYVLSAAPTTNTLTIVLSTANTSNDAIIAYQVLRVAA